VSKAREALKRDTVELVALATEKIIGEKLDAKKMPNSLPRLWPERKRKAMNSKVSRRIIARTVAARLLAEPAHTSRWLKITAAYLIEQRLADDVD